MTGGNPSIDVSSRDPLNLGRIEGMYQLSSSRERESNAGSREGVRNVCGQKRSMGKVELKIRCRDLTAGDNQ